MRTNIRILLLLLILASAAFLLADGAEAGSSNSLVQWQIISKLNYSSQIRLHPHLLLLVTVPWETNNHIFLHCKFTAQIWNLFLNITSMNWTMPEHTSDLLSYWIRRGGMPDIAQLATILGGDVDSIPTIYLEMPLGAKSKSKVIWNNVIEKCESKLTRWKSQYLFVGGRLTLINFVLDALPHFCGIDRLDKIRTFLWLGNKEKRGFHLLKWKVVIIGKNPRGLGIRILKIQNKVLKMK
ncbi:hypothetical protein H5410_004867 [Solanum commersonii]|uniref:Uncharacterized protein n=1 Tax=Solanum commersonii TaxID=4109 RepID=A0A9J6A522_SOLCO|nr:hypothetical protein H5410_004867 [Solanum commersonii]